jgi:hypothetical protein
MIHAWLKGQILNSSLLKEAKHGEMGMRIHGGRMMGEKAERWYEHAAASFVSLVRMQYSCMPNAPPREILA